MIFDMESKKVSHLIDLESDNGRLIFPAWSPDSVHIAFVVNNSWNVVICTL
jgi:Tol biopolymer transport system component